MLTKKQKRKKRKKVLDKVKNIIKNNLPKSRRSIIKDITLARAEQINGVHERRVVKAKKLLKGKI